MVRRKFVGKFRRNTDDYTVTRNVVGSSSVYSDEFLTTTTVTFLSECRRKVVGIFLRAMFRRNSVGNDRRNSDDFKFLVFVGNWSVIRHKRPTTLMSVGTSVGIRRVFL
ncbi:hypothetical protein F2Q70_00025571 [Brassica cretica]|uniref:Uncharacterized protein n=1 Tax=Brassica cretica TaxID=69181 RepID=A0A8S9I914_BRACR|nr:hypothetical protein F2Q68_00024984 [Brassica cretica]KAF2601622.1 hypothetical protein F2Q70_00025571 [Brassica cretica]